MNEILCDDFLSCKEACDYNDYHRSRQWQMFNMSVKGNFGYCLCASSLQRETRKVVWVPFFDHFQIRIHTGCRYVYVWWIFPHFLEKNKVTKMCPKYLLTRYYKWSSQYQILIKIDLANSNNIQHYQVYNVYANPNMAGTRIACPIYTVKLGGTRSDLVA